MAGSFLDTNVLVYLASGHAAKADRAERIVAKGGTISVQVLNELANVGRRKMGLSWRETREVIATMRALLHVAPMTVDVHERGLAVAERHGLSIFDAMIVASALQAECDTLWSEDMQHGMAIENRLRIANPFR